MVDLLISEKQERIRKFSMQRINSVNKCNQINYLLVIVVYEGHSMYNKQFKCLLDRLVKVFFFYIFNKRREIILLSIYILVTMNFRFIQISE